MKSHNPSSNTRSWTATATETGQRNALESRVQAINFDEFHRSACARLRPKAAQYGSRFEAVARDPATDLRIGAIEAGETPRRCARLRIEIFL